MNYGGRRDKPTDPPKAHSPQALKSVDGSMATAQRLVSHLDNNAAKYYKDTITKTELILEADKKYEEILNGSTIRQLLLNVEYVIEEDGRFSVLDMTIKEYLEDLSRDGLY